MTARTTSRPFRSIGLILTGWVIVRAATLFSSAFFERATEKAPIVTAAERPAAIGPERQAQATGATIHPAPRPRVALRPQAAPRRTGSPFRAVAVFGSFRYAAYAYPSARDSYGLSFASIGAMPSSASPSPGPGHRAEPDRDKRWSGSAWLLMRENGPVPLNTGGELGGSQAGMRLFYAIRDPIAVTARVSRPLARAYGGEASVGVALRHRNIGLLLERRVALDNGGRNDFSVTAYGGVSEVALGHGVRFDGYAQAGVVGNDAFADGAARVERTIATVDKTRISAGGGIWGGAQPAAQRIDIGPQIVAQMPIERSNIRISAEWRERVAGEAAPHSGPSLTIGVDF